MGRCETWKRWKTDTQYEVHPDSEQGHICDRPALQGKSQVDRARHYAGGRPFQMLSQVVVLWPEVAIDVKRQNRWAPRNHACSIGLRQPDCAQEVKALADAALA